MKIYKHLDVHNTRINNNNIIIKIAISTTYIHTYVNRTKKYLNYSQKSMKSNMKISGTTNIVLKLIESPFVISPPNNKRKREKGTGNNVGKFE